MLCQVWAGGGTHTERGGSRNIVSRNGWRGGESPSPIATHKRWEKQKLGNALGLAERGMRGKTRPSSAALDASEASWGLKTGSWRLGY